MVVVLAALPVANREVSLLLLSYENVVVIDWQFSAKNPSFNLSSRDVVCTFECMFFHGTGSAINEKFAETK